MKRTGMLVISLMTFLVITFGLVDSRMMSHSYAYDVTVTNKATMSACIHVYYKCIPVLQECEHGIKEFDTKCLESEETSTFKTPGLFCTAAIKVTGPGGADRWVGCLGTANDQTQTCCWNTNWEVNHDNTGYLFMKK